MTLIALTNIVNNIECVIKNNRNNKRIAVFKKFQKVTYNNI